jgi:hypothetical protein
MQLWGVSSRIITFKKNIEVENLITQLFTNKSYTGIVGILHLEFEIPHRLEIRVISN